MTNRALVILALLAACKDKPSVKPTSEPTKSAVTKSVTPAKGAASAAEAAMQPIGPDAAYVGVENTGLVLVENGKARTLIENKYGIRDIAVGPKGEVYATAIAGMWSVVDGVVTKLPDPTSNEQFEKIAVAPDGALWGIDYTGAGKWDGKQWTLVPKSTFGADDTLLYDVAVDTSGHVWISTPDNLWRLDGTTWAKVDTEFAGKKQPFFHDVVAGPSNMVYVTCAAGMFSYDQKTWTRIPVGDDGFSIIENIVVGPDGRVAASGGLDSLVTRAPNEKAKELTLKSAKVKASQAHVQAIDSAGRTWLATDNGVVILGPDSALAQQWMPGTVAGINGKVESIAVTGKRPVLPQLTAAATGTVTGKFIYKGQGVAKAAIELCTSPAAMMFEKTPCSDSPTVFKATTDDTGTFTIANVPIGSYGIAIRPKATWFVTWGTDSCCTEMQPNGSYDIGSMKLDKLE